MGDDLDLDRFNDSDSEPAAEPGGDRDRDAPASSRPASSTAAGTAASPRGSKAERLRAKKAAARAAQRARRREERERFPARPATDDAVDAAADDDDARGVASARARGAHPTDDKTHHGTLTVEGVVVDDVLVLLDRKSGAVYDGERRARDGSHLRVGTWDPAEQRVVPLPERDVRAQLEPPKPKKRPNPAAAADDDHDPDDRGEGEDAANAIEDRMEKPPTEVHHAFEADADDHCETSPEAHANIVNFLVKTADAVGKRPADLVIYDPYYCAGGTRRSFAALGFPNVINRNEDFYAVVAEGRVPEHDVLVTNPPYSADHVERCLTFAARNLAERGRPYFLLLPSYVINKPYYVDALLTGGAEGRAAAERRKAESEVVEADEDEDEGEEDDAEEEEEEEADDGHGSSDSDGDSDSSSSSDSFKVHDGSSGRKPNGRIPGVAPVGGASRRQTLPFYVCPAKRYYYWTPKALLAARRAAAGTLDESGKAHRRKHHIGRLGERTSPFLSFWYCGMGDELQPETLRWHRKLPRARVTGYTVATHPNDLPPHVLDEWDPRRAAAVAKAEAAGEGGGKRMRRYAGFSGANCGQNMPAKHKAKYEEFAARRGGKPKGDNNWGTGKGHKDREGSMFVRPRRKNRY